MILPDEPDLEKLFEEQSSRSVGPQVRCECGWLVDLKLPSVCAKCSKPFPYWTTLEGATVKLSKMDLGHISATIKMLAQKAEQYPSDSEHRRRVEVALDLFYAELADRDKEIGQLRGIEAALKRSLIGKETCDS
jgi:hypothetical protein